MNMPVMIGLATGVGFSVMALAETHEIEVGNTYYDPQFVFVEEGDLIRWTRVQGEHDVFSGESCSSLDGLIESPELNSSNTTFEWIVSNPTGLSQIEYYCTQGAHCVNGNQFGALLFGNGTTHTVSTNGFSFEPQHLTNVNPGDTIIWIHGGGTHSVTFGVGCVAEDGGLHEELSNLNPLVLWTVPESVAGTTQDYFCVPHCSFSMTATIQINEGGGNDCPSDVNDDGTVNVDDLLQLLGEFGTDCSVEACTCDVDGNGVVDVNDLLAMLGVYGSDC